ncbi:hypothetical protein LCGC14_0357410 [marine sediment metagenome]|uniref:Uncharacterized protein n=1 Tax=marine sediment metagenome TaxID=412755 RepID=A0A0F9TS60_9ZZZZ
MSDDLTKQDQGALALPDYLQGEEVKGVDDLAKFIVPPMLKIVQDTSDRDVKNTFNLGDVYASPQKVLISRIIMNEHDKPGETGTPFYIAPIFFYAEAICWRPIGSTPAIVERTTDQTDPLFVKARNPKLWNEVIDGDDCRNCEHLNFVCMILGEGVLNDTPVVLSFSRSGYKVGQRFAAIIKMRKAPIYSTQFGAQVVTRSNSKNEWYGIDIFNPPGDSGIDPFVPTKEVFEMYKLLHEAYAEAHASSSLVADYEETNVEGEPEEY